MSFQVGNYLVDTTNMLSSGTFGVTYLARDIPNQRPAAAKCVSYKEGGRTNQELFAMCMNEVEQLNQLKDQENVVRLLQHVDDGHRKWLVLEHCDLGDLPSYLRSHPTDITRKLKIMYEITTVIAYMHSQQPVMVHYDIKPGNVLMSTKGNQHVAKLTGFGQAKLYEVNPGEMHVLMSTDPSSTCFKAPEFFFDTGPTIERYRYSDVFSLGLLYHVILNYDNNQEMLPVSCK